MHNIMKFFKRLNIKIFWDMMTLKYLLIKLAVKLVLYEKHNHNRDIMQALLKKKNLNFINCNLHIQMTIMIDYECNNIFKLHNVNLIICEIGITFSLNNC